MSNDRELTPERLDRNWGELLQELRVAQTGVQILTAFLLTVPFSAGFPDLEHHQKIVYLAVLECSILSAVLLLTPVALHRALFRRGERKWLVARADQLARAGLVLLAAANGLATWLVVDVVLGPLVATLLAAPVAALVIGLWWLFPTWRRRTRPEAFDNGSHQQ
jgi:O-antigen/teichoic acid export membrane protein